MEMLQELASAPDRAVIVVTHDSRIYSFADRIATMSDGQITSVKIRDETELKSDGNY
jgi:putative ABC transport system ATP-binding protein